MMKKTLVAAALLALLVAPVIGHAGDMGKGGMKMGKDMGENAHARSELHRGTSVMTKAHHFEVVFLNDGIRVYPYDAKQGVISAKGMKGGVTLTYEKGDPKELKLAYHEGAWVGEGNEQTQMNDYLFAPIDLSSAEAGSFEAKFALSDLGGDAETEAAFTQPFKGVMVADFACPMHPDAWGETAKSSCPLCGMYTSLPRNGATAEKSGSMEHMEEMGHGNH